MARIEWDDYFMEFAKVALKRSTCIRRQVGAVLVRDNRVITTGYNGAPKGIEHCDKQGCLREKLKIPSGQRHEVCKGAHAEENAIIQAARYGISTKDTTLYTTNTPCTHCAKMIINAGIKRVVYNSEYPDELGRQLLVESGTLVERIKNS